MTITCNGEAVSTTACSLADLLTARLGEPAPPGVAVAVNGEVLPRSVWAAPLLLEGDVVEIVTAVQGG
ncbi:hypothetical protein ASE01_06675 [Nocardioides sp. Root190]|uniref:sulfur carrier protein ThiS n=1 Tax=Nocardioides sp. Root190 TaxID=1736488 RepID=UPI0006F23B2A|nr:sulfur carrier protein ThiS [Nocardioides sp. Root190]KRB77865.1 hypothetical protein ASE01_06675 [Nocardioides sp. Root190]